MTNELNPTVAETNLDAGLPTLNTSPAIEKIEPPKPIPSIDELISKMEAITKSQMEIMEKKYQEQIAKLQKINEEEKMKNMGEKEREDHIKRLDTQKQIEEKQMLLQQIQELEAEKTLARNSAFVNQTISNKPYLKAVIEKMKIQTPEEYDRYIKPMEDTYKKHDEMQVYLRTNTNRDVFSNYEAGNGLFSNSSPDKDKEEILKAKAKALLESII